MDYRSYRYMVENQQNMYMLFRLLMLQEQNYRHILTSGRPERRFTTEELTFSIPTTTTTGTGVQTPPIAPSTRTVLTSNEITQTTTNYIYQDILNLLQRVESKLHLYGQKDKYFLL